MADDAQVKVEETQVSERGTGKKKIPGHIVVSETTDPTPSGTWFTPAAATKSVLWKLCARG